MMNKIKELWNKIAGFLPFGNKPEVVIILVFFAVSFFIVRTCEAAETMLEFGAGVLSGEYVEGQYLAIEERFSEGRYSVGFVLMGEQTCKCGEGDVPLDVNIAIFVSRNVFWKRLELGIGIAYWEATSRAIGSHLTIQPRIAIRLTDNFDFRLWTHNSNSGLSSPNLGQDRIGFSYRFN